MLLKTKSSAGGSPPQVRGKLKRQPVFELDNRITPAGAGKTAVVRQAAAIAWDHPRRCGENYKQSLTRCRRLGSPPQVRGKRQHPELALLFHGITPAGAGKTGIESRKINLRGDHPRRCGENHASISTPDVVPGSPPQVRGKPAFRSREPNPNGITPAGAGKTLRLCLPW